MAINKDLSRKYMTLYKNPKIMNKPNDILKKLDLSDHEIAIYVALLSLGSSSIRKIAEKAGLNRGVSYNALKTLEKKGLVSFYHKEKHQHFTAEDPEILKKILLRKKQDIEELEEEVTDTVSSLSSLVSTSSNKPVVKFYENYTGIRNILEDVLSSVSKQKEKEYVAFSSSAIRPFLYHKNAFPSFSAERIKKKIFVRTIATGDGGTTYGKDERKWLSKEDTAPTYKLVYAGKVAMISVNKNGIPHGLIIEDQNLYQTELSLFNSLWKKLS